MARQKPTLPGAILFACIGIATLVGGLMLWRSESAFQARALHANGTVVGMEASRGSKSTTYHPVVKYVLPSGDTRQFRSKVGSNPPSYQVGDAVKVLYDPQDFNNAEIDSFMNLFMGPIVLMILGLIFFLVGIATSIDSLRRMRVRSYLLKNGRRITTTVSEIHDSTFDLQRRAAAATSDTERALLNKFLARPATGPYVIVSQWTDENGQLRTFESEPLRKNPAGLIQIGQNIDVLANPTDFGQSVMDLTSVPGLK